MTFWLPLWTVYTFQTRVYSLRKEFARKGANSFPSEMIPNYRGGNNEIDRAASPGIVPIHS